MKKNYILTFLNLKKPDSVYFDQAHNQKAYVLLYPDAWQRNALGIGPHVAVEYKWIGKHANQEIPFGAVVHTDCTWNTNYAIFIHKSYYVPAMEITIHVLPLVVELR